MNFLSSSVCEFLPGHEEVLKDFGVEKTESGALSGTEVNVPDFIDAIQPFVVGELKLFESYPDAAGGTIFVTKDQFQVIVHETIELENVVEEYGYPFSDNPPEGLRAYSRINGFEAYFGGDVNKWAPIYGEFPLADFPILCIDFKNKTVNASEKLA